MYDGKRILAIIPARAGSKGIKDKNIIELCGKPLIAYTIEAASECDYIDQILVSTDGEKIAEIARMYGANVPFLRPAELAKDTSKTIDAIVDAIEKLKSMDEEYDLLILLQPTSPLRTGKQITEAIELLFERKYESLVSVNPVEVNPLLIRRVDKSGLAVPILQENSTVRRQDMNQYYRVNGSIYINYIKDINLKTSFNDNQGVYIMDCESGIDIDDERDLCNVKKIIEKSK